MSTDNKRPNLDKEILPSIIHNPRYFRRMWVGAWADPFHVAGLSQPPNFTKVVGDPTMLWWWLNVPLVWTPKGIVAPGPWSQFNVYNVWPE